MRIANQTNVLSQEFRDEVSINKFPFMDNALLVSKCGKELPINLFIDISISTSEDVEFPIYISKMEDIGNDCVQLTFVDSLKNNVGTCDCGSDTTEITFKGMFVGFVVLTNIVDLLTYCKRTVRYFDTNLPIPGKMLLK